MAIELADKLYTSTQVADILGVSLRTLYRYMEDNKIKSMRTASGRHRFTKDHIIEFLNAGRPGGMEEVSHAPVYGNQRNPGYSNFSQNQGQQSNVQRGSYFDNMQSPTNNMSNPYGGTTGFNPAPQPVAARSNVYAPENNFNTPPEDKNKFNQPVVTEDDDFEFDVTDYDYDKEETGTKTDVHNSDNITDNEFNTKEYPQQSNVDYSQQRNEDRFESARQPEVQVQPEPQHQQAQRPNYGQSPFAPPASNPAREDSRSEAVDIGSSLNIRYYRSDYTDLIELAKKIKDTSNAKELEYAFTLFAGLSLHFLIRPFTVLNFYANPEDMQLWKDELRLVPTQKRDDANVGIIINTDIVFVPTKEIGGFKVVDDKVLLKDLSAVREEELVKQFRQHLTSI